MRLAIRRREGESWREAVARHGARFGLEEETLEEFDELIAGGEIPDRAAWYACYEAVAGLWNELKGKEGAGR